MVNIPKYCIARLQIGILVDFIFSHKLPVSRGAHFILLCIEFTNCYFTGTCSMRNFIISLNVNRIDLYISLFPQFLFDLCFQ